MGRQQLRGMPGLPTPRHARRVPYRNYETKPNQDQKGEPPMSYTFDIELNDPLEAAIDDIIGEVEEAIENIRKYREPRLMHQVDVDIGELLAEHQAIGIVWDIEHVK